MHLSLILQDRLALQQQCPKQRTRVTIEWQEKLKLQNQMCLVLVAPKSARFHQSTKMCQTLNQSFRKRAMNAASDQV